MDDTAIKVPVMVTVGKVNPILKKDPHHQGGAASATDLEAPSSPSAAGATATKRDADGKSTTPGRDKKNRLTWDEHAIEEHDLLRGTRMKIDEPDTPYTHYDHESDAESNTSGQHPRSPDEKHPDHDAPTLATQWGDISSKLQAVADKRDACPLSPAPSRDSNMSDAEDEAKKKDHEKKFKNMRKKHYNEAEMMRRWKAEHANDDDDDEDDEEDGKMEE